MKENNCKKRLKCIENNNCKKRINYICSKYILVCVFIFFYNQRWLRKHRKKSIWNSHDKYSEFIIDFTKYSYICNSFIFDILRLLDQGFSFLVVTNLIL